MDELQVQLPVLLRRVRYGIKQLHVVSLVLQLQLQADLQLNDIQQQRVHILIIGLMEQQKVFLLTQVIMHRVLRQQHLDILPLLQTEIQVLHSIEQQKQHLQNILYVRFLQFGTEPRKLQHVPLV